MSLSKDMLTQIEQMEGDGVQSGERFRDKDGNLKPHPSVASIDPINIKGGSPEKDQAEFDKEVKDKEKGQ